MVTGSTDGALPASPLSSKPFPGSCQLRTYNNSQRQALILQVFIELQACIEHPSLCPGFYAAARSPREPERRGAAGAGTGTGTQEPSGSARRLLQ